MGPRAKALILAGGLGTRLRPLTDTIPKCLVPIRGRALLDYWVECLAEAGIREARINTHAHADRVREYIGAVNAERPAPPGGVVRAGVAGLGRHGGRQRRPGRRRRGSRHHLRRQPQRYRPAAPAGLPPPARRPDDHGALPAAQPAGVRDRGAGRAESDRLVRREAGAAGERPGQRGAVRAGRVGLPRDRGHAVVRPGVRRAPPIRGADAGLGLGRVLPGHRDPSRPSSMPNASRARSSPIGPGPIAAGAGRRSSSTATAP